MPLTESKKPMIIAHSGCMNKTPDMLEYIDAGYCAGAGCFEVDLNTTLDGVGILSHDAVILDDKHQIFDLHETFYQEAIKIKKSLELFEKALEKAIFYGRLLMVDIKDINAVPSAMKIIENASFMNNVFFAGLEPKQAQKFLDQYPQANLLVNLKIEGRNSRQGRILSGIAKEAASNCKAMGAAGVNIQWTFCSQAWVEFAQSLDLITCCWTVDPIWAMRKVISWGTDLIVTNRPDKLFMIKNNIAGFHKSLN
jgi:glycerophosphoryl diester phosphodiesterase